MTRRLVPWAFFPDEEASSIFEVDYGSLQESEKEAVLFDLDNTIARWGEDDLSEKVIGLLDEIVGLGFKVGILTNSKKKKVKSFVESLPYPCQFNAQKPRRKNFFSLLDRMEVEPSRAVMVGDQLLTDVLGANRAGLYSIRVEPIERGREFSFTAVNRLIEDLLFSLRDLFRIIKRFKY